MEIRVGRMIQRITRETTRGLTELDARDARNVERGLGVVLWRASRWRVQSGIVDRGNECEIRSPSRMIFASKRTELWKI